MRVENRVRELGFPSYTIIRPVFFMENLSSPWFKPGIDEGKLTVSVQPDTRLQMIAAADIGKYGALAFEKHEELNKLLVAWEQDKMDPPYDEGVFWRLERYYYHTERFRTGTNPEVTQDVWDRLKEEATRMERKSTDHWYSMFHP